MTLDEAIEHAEKRVDDSQCGCEHKQLAEWLKELQERREFSNCFELRLAAKQARRLISKLISNIKPGTDCDGYAWSASQVLKDALKAPARNCDRFSRFDDAIRAYAKERPDPEHNEWTTERYARMAMWLLADVDK